MDAFDNRANASFRGTQPNQNGVGESNQASPTGSLLSSQASATMAAAAAAVTQANQQMLIPDARGRITLPAGVSIDDIQVNGNDLIITLPNGDILIIPNGAVNVPAIAIGDGVAPASTVAQLLEGVDELNPEAGLRSSGGNFGVAEGDIQDPFDLGDLLPYTELAFPEPRDEEILPYEEGVLPYSFQP